jgi:release factor glutamine methyltransferase
LNPGRVTVLEAIRKTSEFLDSKGVDSSRLQAELLLAHVLKLPRMKLYLSFDRVLLSSEVDGFRELVRRRGRREPLQHIVGTVGFCGLEFATRPHALIPRPETETLAELGWQFLNPHPAPAPAAFDLGTGTGCLAVSLAVRCPRARIWAGDISPDALALARENASRHAVDDRLQFLEGDGFSPLPPEARFDLIVSNPPYIPSAEIQTLQIEVRDHDPRAALDGGIDGLDFYRRLAAEAGAFLNAGGRLMVEFGDGQAPALRDLFSAGYWVVEAIRQDASMRDRFLIARPA